MTYVKCLRGSSVGRIDAAVSAPAIPADAAECSGQEAARRDAASFIILVERVIADTRRDQFKLTASQMGVLEGQYDRYLFDGFPMFSPDGKKLVFASNRNAAKQGDTNVFIADWVW